MAWGGVDELQQLYFASRHGVLNKDNGGFYQSGKTYGLEVKLFVAAKYLDHKERRGGLRPVLRKVAADCRVEWNFVAKIERELMENERVLAPDEKYLAHATNLVGPGSRSMSDEDFFLLYMLFLQEPMRSLKSYVYWLFCCTGTIVSESTPSKRADAKWQRQRGGTTHMDDPTDNNDSDDKYNNDNVDKQHK